MSEAEAILAAADVVTKAAGSGAGAEGGVAGALTTMALVLAMQVVHSQWRKRSATKQERPTPEIHPAANVAELDALISELKSARTSDPLREVVGQLEAAHALAESDRADLRRRIDAIDADRARMAGVESASREAVARLDERVKAFQAEVTRYLHAPRRRDDE